VKAGDITLYQSSDDLTKKQISPFMLNKWMGGSSHPLEVLLVNETVNKYLFELYKHPDLLYKLCCTAVAEDYSKFSFIKTKSIKNSSIAVEVISEYFQCNTNSASLFLKSTSIESLIEMANSLGYDAESIKKLKKELV
jgi:hypothetical protein